MERNIEGLKEVAQFMGYNYYGHNDPRLLVDGKQYTPGWKRKATSKPRVKEVFKEYLCRNNNDLRYDTDWNSFMEVRRALLDTMSPLILEYGRLSNEQYQRWFDLDNESSSNISGCFLKLAFEDLVETIQWCKEQGIVYRVPEPRIIFKGLNQEGL